MNTKKKIERYLRAAPKPPAPEGLLDRLGKDVAATEFGAYRSVLSRWFAPTGQSISVWRVAAAAAIVIGLMLPISYGAAKVIKKYFVLERKTLHTFNYGDRTYSVGTGTTVAGDDFANEDEARKAYEEAKHLVKTGKAEEIAPGIYKVVLSDGTIMGIGGSQAFQSREELKKQFDEIEELRKAGRFEKIYKPEHDFVVNGVKHRYFEARYTLSNGKVVTLGSSEPVRAKEQKQE
jgi:hypothetical protein